MANPIRKIARKTVSILPPTWPAKIYNTAIKVPGLKTPMSRVIQHIAPTHVDLPEGTVTFDKEDPVMAGQIGLGKYEQHTISLFRSLLRPGMNVVDIGANLGYYTVIAASRVGPSGHVFAYEPDPHNYALLRKNIAANGFGNVTAIPAALADKSSTRELYFADNQCTLSFDDKKGTGISETVRTQTLDESLASLSPDGIMQTHGVLTYEGMVHPLQTLRAYDKPRVDVIKMDIEGAEPIAFAGMKETLARNPRVTILCEFYPNSIKRLGYSPVGFLQEIASLGFKLAAIDEDRGMTTPITDIQAFYESFQGKEATRNFIATR